MESECANIRRGDWGGILERALGPDPKHGFMADFPPIGSRASLGLDFLLE